MATKDWKLITDDKTYKVWKWIDNRVGWYNPMNLVINTDDDFVVFLDTGSFGGGTKVLKHTDSMIKAVKFAKEYMKKH
jgi:hypothetical protein